MTEHFIRLCSCGTVLGQCRCPDPNKRKIVVKDGCDACKEKAAAKAKAKAVVPRGVRL
jgi:hypothetical protein